MDKTNVKIGSVLHYWNYFKQNFKISFKTATEYKGNLISILMENTIYFIITILFGYILFENVFSISSFGFKEFLLLVFLLGIYNETVGMFWYGSFSSLDTLIKTGDFSNYVLSRPLNPFLGFLLIRRFNALPFIILDLAMYLPLIIYYFNFQLLPLLISILIMIFLILFGVLVIRFLDSFCWHFLEARKILLYQLYFQGIQHNVGKFPMLFFSKNPIILIFLSGFPFYYISMWIIPLLTIGTFQIQRYEIIVLCSISIISIIGIYFNWKIGLKKYEAYG